MKRKIIKISSALVLLIVLLTSTMIPALADSSLDGSYRPLARYISENGTLVQSSLNGWQQTTSQFKFIGDDIQSADIVEIGFPSTYAPSYNTMPSISGTISVTNNSPALSIVLANKEVFYITSNCIYGKNAVGEFEVISQVSEYFSFSVYITMVDDGYGFAYVLTVDGSVYYGIAYAEGLRSITSFGGVFLYPGINNRSSVFIENLVFSEMTVDQSLMAGYGVLFFAMNEELEFIVAETYQQGYNDGYSQGFEEGGDLGYEEGYADGLADGSASGGGNTDGSYDEGYAAGKTDGFNEGYAQGMTEGQVIGQDIGYTVGLNAGKELGYADGKADGLANLETEKQNSYNEGKADGLANLETEKQNSYNEGKTDGLANLEKEKTDAYNNGYNVGFDAGDDYGYSEGYKDGEEAGWSEGYEVGMETGWGEGYENGKQSGYNDGFAAGSYDNGYSDGYADGYDVGHFDGEVDGYSSAYNDGYVDGKYTGDLEGYNRGYGEGHTNGYFTGMEEAAELYYNQIYQDALDKIDENQGTGVQGFLAGMWAGTQGFVQEILDGFTFSGLSLRSIVTTCLAIALAAFLIRLLKG